MANASSGGKGALIAKGQSGNVSTGTAASSPRGTLTRPICEQKKGGALWALPFLWGSKRDCEPVSNISAETAAFVRLVRQKGRNLFRQVNEPAV